MNLLLINRENTQKKQTETSYIISYKINLSILANPFLRVFLEPYNDPIFRGLHTFISEERAL